MLKIDKRTLHLTIISLLGIRNLALGKKLKRALKSNEMLKLENQALIFALRGIRDPNMDPDVFAKVLSEQVSFIDMIRKM